jgi:regulator of protease activity HflC (stomatin/prohibitin superfamily)
MHVCYPQGVAVSDVLGASQAAVAAAEEAQARREAVAARAAAARNKKTIAQQILAVSRLLGPLPSDL